MLRIIKEEHRRLIKAKLIYSGDDTWQIKAVSDKSGKRIAKRDFIFRGDSEAMRKKLISLKAKDCDTEPASMRKDSYKHIVQVAQEKGRNTVWIWSNMWPNSNTIGGN